MPAGPGFVFSSTCWKRPQAEANRRLVAASIALRPGWPSVRGHQGQFPALAQLQHAHCVLSGGAAQYIVPHLPLPVERIDNLVLHGLHVALLSETP